MGPPKAGEKLAPVPREIPPKPLKDYLPCPKAGMVISWTWADKLAAGCRTAKGEWLRVLDRTDCASRMIEVGPSAPQPLAWGIVGMGWQEGRDVYDMIQVAKGYEYLIPGFSYNGETYHDYACRTGKMPW